MLSDINHKTTAFNIAIIRKSRSECQNSERCHYSAMSMFRCQLYNFTECE